MSQTATDAGVGKATKQRRLPTGELIPHLTTRLHGTVSPAATPTIQTFEGSPGARGSPDFLLESPERTPVKLWTSSCPDLKGRADEDEEREKRTKQTHERQQKQQRQQRRQQQLQHRQQKKRNAGGTPPARIAWRVGMWRTNRGFDYYISPRGQVFFEGSHEPWAHVKTKRGGGRLRQDQKGRACRSGSSEKEGEGKMSQREAENSLQFVELVSLTESHRYQGILRDRERIAWDDGDAWKFVPSPNPLQNQFSTPTRAQSDGFYASPRGFSTTNSRLGASVGRRRGSLQGEMVTVKRLNTTTYGVVVGFDHRGRCKVQVEENGRMRVFTTPVETLRPAHALSEDKDSKAVTTISQVENPYYTHNFVRVISRTTGFPITHSGVLVETSIEGQPKHQTVVDLIEYSGKPYVALRQYMKPFKIDNWNDDVSIAKFSRQGFYDKGKKPWRKTLLQGKAISFTVWAEDTDSEEAAQKAHETWIQKIESYIKEATKGEFKLMSRNCQHAAAYTINKLKKEVGIADERHASPPNWLFRVFASESTWVPKEPKPPTQDEPNQPDAKPPSPPTTSLAQPKPRRARKATVGGTELSWNLRDLAEKDAKGNANPLRRARPRSKSVGDVGYPRSPPPPVSPPPPNPLAKLTVPQPRFEVYSSPMEPTTVLTPTSVATDSPLDDVREVQALNIAASSSRTVGQVPEEKEATEKNAVQREHAEENNGHDGTGSPASPSAQGDDNSAGGDPPSGR